MILSPVSRYVIGAVLLIWSASAWSAPALHAPAGGTVRAVVIGIDKYPKLPPEAQLRGSAADARDISAALAAAGIPASNVRTIIDGDATRGRFIAEMRDLITESKAGDLAIIAYSGHGMVVNAYKKWDDGSHKMVGQLPMSGYDPGDLQNGQEVIVDRELRAWYGRLNDNGVDVLVVMDACFGGRARAIAPGGPEIRVRQFTGAQVADWLRDNFDTIPIKPSEASRDVDDMRHVSFFAGSGANSTVPEMNKIDPANPAQVRGALSYYLTRAIGGAIGQNGHAVDKVGRSVLWKFVSPAVRNVTNYLQQIPPLGPKKSNDDVVFVLDVPQTGPGPVSEETLEDDPVRVAIVNGAEDSFDAIQKGRAPFVRSNDVATADLVWDVANGTALSSSSDLITSNINAYKIGDVIDRTWAVRRIQRLATLRGLDVTLGDSSTLYKLKDHVPLSAAGVLDSYLTAVNIGGNGELSLLFPTPKRAEGAEESCLPTDPQDFHVSTDSWARWPQIYVTPPVGTEFTTVIATRALDKELTGWLRCRNGKYDAVAFARMLAARAEADSTMRIGTAGLFTTN